MHLIYQLHHLKSKLFIFLSSFFFCTSITAQQYYFDDYGVKEGLSQSSVYNISQDKNAVLWLGTGAGLSSFDGKEFVNFSVDEGLAEGSVKATISDSLGNIWAGHAGGGVSLIQNKKAKILFNFKADITSFAFAKDGSLWLGTYKEGAIQILNPYDYHSDSLQIRQYKGQDGLSDIVFQVVALKNGTICFVTDVGVKQYIPSKKEFSNLVIKDMPAYFQITCMLEQRNGDLWLGTYNGGLYHQSASGEFKIYDFMRDGIASNWISALTEDNKGNVWIGTWGGGISLIDTYKKVITINSDNGLPDAYIRCFTTDREGNLLIGTKEAGLLVFKGFMFSSYGISQGLPNMQTKAITQDKDNHFWVGTGNGIAVFKKENNQLELIQQYGEQNGLFFPDIRFIKKDKQQNIWLGTWGGGVMQFNPYNKRFESNYRINSYMSQLNITALEVDKTNNLWVGTSDGLVYYEINKGLVDRLTQVNGLAGNEISCLFVDNNNVVWVGSREKGLSKIIGNQISIVELEKQHLTINSMAQDKEGNLWIGTEGKGVVVFDGKKIIKEITTSDHLLSNYISYIIVDDENNLWIGSNKGLNKIDQTTHAIYSYNDKMGYKGNESKSNACYKDKAGDLWLGTIEGLIHLNKKFDAHNDLEPKVFINDLMINFENRKLEDNLTLNYKEKAIAFYYKGICLTHPEAVNYKYMLEGLDEDWRPVTKQTFVTYSPLPPGNYTFKVIASNNNGVWSTVPATFSFVITPPFWQQWWFYLIAGLLTFYLVYQFASIRERRQRAINKALEIKVKERTEEVVQKSKEIELKNRDIIDSINYAKRIQYAILPSKDEFEKTLKNTYVLFHPKDIVSGDFYWNYALSKPDNKEEKLFFAAADCTGHGVPGAFMSIVGYNLLDKIVGEYKVTQPAEILNHLNKGVSATLRQNAEHHQDVKDGMDISLCSYQASTHTLEFAGAFNPLYIVSENEIIESNGEVLTPSIIHENGLKLYEVKADRFPIGNINNEARKFTNHSFTLKKGDMVYLFSDGYADQFGGPNNKKFRYKQFKELLLSVYHLPIEEQKKKLITVFEDWRGNNEQVDDIIIIGSKVGA